jgi:predicted aconitase with swiveling domain
LRPSHQTGSRYADASVVGGCAEGEAIVTRDTISGWGGINEREGTAWKFPCS